MIDEMATIGLISRLQFAHLVGCAEQTLSKYMDRAEFNHIEKILIGRKVHFGNINIHDVKRFKQLVFKNKNINYFKYKK